MESTQCLRRDIQGVISLWQEILHLEHWQIVWKECSTLKSDNALMKILPTRSRSVATIFIATDTINNHSSRELEELIIHELVHLLYDPLVEEHLFQLQYAADTSRGEEHKARFIRVLEKSVEQTAQMLRRMVPNGASRDNVLQRMRELANGGHD